MVLSRANDLYVRTLLIFYHRKNLTTAEWRANQLADSLAKKGAYVSEVRVEADKLIKDAGNALVQSAARLGVVTLAANSKVINFAKPDGSIGQLVKRESSAPPPAQAKAKEIRTEKKTAALLALQPKCPAPPPLAAPLCPLTLQQAKAKKRKHADHCRLHTAAACLHTHLQAATLNAQPQAVTANDRLAALRARASGFLEVGPFQRQLNPRLALQRRRPGGS